MITRTRIILFALPFLAGCAMPLTPELAACEARMADLAEGLLPSFEKLGYRPKVVISIDEKLANSRGFPSPSSVYGDSMAGGRIRLRPVVCTSDSLASVVVAHEMSHVALAHWGMTDHGVVLAWEPPRQELEADALARKVLAVSGAPKPIVDFLECRLGQCDENPAGMKRKPVGTR